jgi:hypothetical protein
MTLAVISEGRAAVIAVPARLRMAIAGCARSGR